MLFCVIHPNIQILTTRSYQKVVLNIGLGGR